MKKLLILGLTGLCCVYFNQANAQISAGIDFGVFTPTEVESDGQFGG